MTRTGSLVKRRRRGTNLPEGRYWNCAAGPGRLSVAPIRQR